MKAPNITKGPWAKDRFGSLRGADDEQITLSGAGLAIACTNHTEERQANAVMVIAAPMLAEAGAAALAELRNTIQEFGGCDHAVNICFCSTIHIADSLQAALLSAGYTED